MALLQNDNNAQCCKTQGDFANLHDGTLWRQWRPSWVGSEMPLPAAISWLQTWPHRPSLLLSRLWEINAVESWTKDIQSNQNMINIILNQGTESHYSAVVNCIVPPRPPTPTPPVPHSFQDPCPLPFDFPVSPTKGAEYISPTSDFGLKRVSCVDQ